MQEIADYSLLLPAVVNWVYSIEGDKNYLLDEEIRHSVNFFRFNLIHDSTDKKYDIIICRNVMIYFDGPTKDKLVNKFYDFTSPNGFFFIGHSETINKAATKYTYLRPAMYRKEGK